MKKLFVLILCLTTLIYLIPTSPKVTIEEHPVAVVQALAEPIVLEVVPEPIQPVETIVGPLSAPQPIVATDCASEIAKYDWDYQTAYNVMMAESGGRSWALNDNPATGDYSVGCFQINLYGGNARNRPSEAELKDASVNVAFAYKLYSGNGHSFIGQWGVCRKIHCY